MPDKMQQRARKHPTPRVWTPETAFTRRIGARVPLPLCNRLKAYQEATALNMTDVLIAALDEYLKKRGA